MRTVNTGVVCFAFASLLTGCISPYHAWNGVKGYQEEQLDKQAYRVSYVADQATRWSRVDAYLARRCKALLGSPSAQLADVHHAVHAVTVMSSAAIGAPVVSGDQVTMPSASAPHEVVFRLKRAEAHCSTVE